MRILYIEDSTQDADLARRELARRAPGLRLDVAHSLSEGRARLGDGTAHDLVLLDLSLPDGSGVGFVLEIQDRNLPVAIVILTGSGDERTAVSALKAGADDYLVKTGDYLARLPAILESARAARRLNREKRTRPLRVLYAEHDPVDVDLARHHLARHAPHIRLVTVADGPALLERLEAGDSYDALALDYRLRGMDGLEVLQLLRERGLLATPVVLVTGHGDEAVAVQALRLGAVDYLVKRPGYLHELAATLENAHHRALLVREQEALRASEERFRQLAENIDEVFWMSDIGFSGVLYVSPAYARVWGRSPASLYADPRSWMDAVHAEDRPAVERWMIESRSLGPSQVEYRIYRPDRTVRWIRDRASPVRNAQGVVYRVVGVAEDITERRRLEERFLHAQKMEAVGQLSGGVAHDFNNLLTVIQCHLGLIESGEPLAPETAESFREITQAATRAAHLTRQLLAFSRRQVLQSRDLDLTAVVANITKMLQRIVGEDVALEFTATSEPVWVHADSGMIEQILMNLTVNARDAMPGGGRLRIGVTIASAAELAAARTKTASTGSAEEGPAPAEAYARLAVADSGTGIAPEVIGRIFEPFFTTKGVGQGTGLGLATVYGITRQHGGTVTVASLPGEGATFEVFLPLIRPPAPEASSPLAEQPARGGSERILLVEDDPSVADLLQLALGQAGYAVTAADSGPAALALWPAIRDQVDLLLTDLVMPDGCTGRDLARRLRADRPTLPVLFISGYSAELAGLELGDPAVLNFLPKPFTIAELKTALRRILDGPSRALGAPPPADES